MAKRILAFLVFSLALLVIPNWAATCSNDSTVAPSCTNTFTAADPTGTYEFFGNGRLVVQFDTVLTPSPGFTLTVTVSNPSDPLPLDPKEFPSNTVCVKYPINSTTQVCDRYDFSGSATGPHGVPVKNKDYKGLITLTLVYDTSGTTHNPAFGHAPGDITMFTEDILTSYYEAPAVITLATPAQSSAADPGMGGRTPGLSSVVALDEPFTENGDTFCSPMTLTSTNNPSEQKDQIEVAFKLVGVASNCTTGTGLRDKTARISVSTFDGSGNLVFPPIKNAEGNKFHWDNKNGLNEYDISLEGLDPGTYTITVFSSKFSPQHSEFCFNGASVVPCPI